MVNKNYISTLKKCGYHYIDTMKHSTIETHHFQHKSNNTSILIEDFITEYDYFLRNDKSNGDTSIKRYSSFTQLLNNLK